MNDGATPLDKYVKNLSVEWNALDHHARERLKRWQSTGTPL